MENISKLAEIVKARDELVSWWKNSEKQDSQSHGAYVLIVNTQTPDAKFCGQAYAGANNYHEAPAVFNEKLKAAFDATAKQRAEETYTALLASYNASIAAIRESVMAELDAVSAYPKQ